jgi:hypothetical protein
VGDGAKVYKFKFAADGYAPRQACHGQAFAFEDFTQGMGSGLSFCGEISRQNDFLHNPIVSAVNQFL